MKEAFHGIFTCLVLVFAISYCLQAEREREKGETFQMWLSWIIASCDFYIAYSLLRSIK